MKDPLSVVVETDHNQWQGGHQQALEELERIGRTAEDYVHTLEAYGEATKTHKGTIDDIDIVETTFRVRYAETDQMGIVHHASYVVWLEEGRSQWMRAHGNSYAQFEKEDLLLVVSECCLRYNQPARYDQRVTIRCWVERVRSRQVQFNYEVVDADTGSVFVDGYTQHICLDREGKVTRIPDKWTAFLRQRAPARVTAHAHA